MPAQFREGIAVAAFGGDVDSVNNGLASQRFSQQGNHAEIERSANVVGVAQAGHEDHLRRQGTAKRGADRKAVRRRHDEIEKNDVGIVDRCGIEGFAA